MRLILLAQLCLLVGVAFVRGDGNRLTYLDNGNDPYYVSRAFPKLITPQWVGEPNVDAVVILAIDDMRDPAVYEKFLAPAIQRLKKIDGKAPISIMTCRIKPDDPRLLKMLADGLSLEVHTIDHPCPILAGSDLAKAKKTYDDCVDMMDAIPGSHAVAFRTPCCDSKNTLSPRLLSEIFNSISAKGNFLEADSSVFHRFTADDPALPRQLVLDAHGADRYARYVPFPSFANSIHDYPYPYVIGNLCWEFPCITPSDWESFNVQGKANPQLLADWEAQLDATVIKKGAFTLVFHPYGWSSPEQIAQLVDYADTKYGKRVKFLTFRDAVARLTKNLTGGQPLRAAHGADNGVRLLDLNNDGYLDVIFGNANTRQTRIWNPQTSEWIVTDFPIALVTTGENGRSRAAGAQFGMFRADGAPSVLINNGQTKGAWSFVDNHWIEEPGLRAALELDGGIFTSRDGIDQGVRLRDLDHDGICELIVSNPQRQAIYRWDQAKGSWDKLPFALPNLTTIVDAKGRDAGLRFVDVDQDGYDDVIFSNSDRYSLHLFTDIDHGWSRQVMAGKRIAGDQTQIPPIVRADGSNNGAWFMRRTMWVQNEDTALLPDVVDRRTFNDLLAKTEPGPRGAQASLESIQTQPGFKVELAASEPVVEDPIAFAWGPDGRLWEVEMGDYPLGIDGKGKPGGRIRILESTHHDGHYDKSTVFLDNLPFPTGVMPWDKGVLVTDAPYIFYAEDTKRDGHCDYRKNLYSGFGEGNQQHRANGLLWGLDNWVHGANGNSGGTIRSLKTGQSVNISGRDFRIRPDEGLIETETGQTQYGHTMDDWGNWFGCDNTNPMYQFVLEDHYLRRNRALAPPNARVQTSDTPGASAVYPTSRTVARFNDPWGANHFTSANSVIVYRDDLFGPSFYGNSFVSEPVHNLVHREIMRREGIVFHSKRPDDQKESEFWASSDNWTRPTMLRVGPDGALWIADMYRYVIEHPEWIPKDWQARLDLRAGHDKGRIYRVYPVGTTPRPIPVLDQLTPEQFVAGLDSPSGWQRDTIQQMLVQKQEKSLAPLLEKLARDSKNPLARLHALCTLDGLNALEGSTLVHALSDSEPGVRRHAVRLCEGRFDKAPEIADRLPQLVNDPDAQVRLQLGYTLGEWNDPRAASALAKLLARDAADAYITAACFSSVSQKNIDAIASDIVSQANEKPLAENVAVGLLKMSSTWGQSGVTARILSAVVPRSKQYSAADFASVAALLDALDAGNTSLAKLGAGNDADLKQAAAGLSSIFDAARASAQDANSAPPMRAAAVRLLGRGLDHRDEDLQLLATFLSPRASESLQQSAVGALAHVRTPRTAALLLSNWKSFGPALRSQVLDVLLAWRDGSLAVLSGLEQKQILPTDIDAPHRQRLLQNSNLLIRNRASALLAETVKPDRQQVIDSFKAVLTTPGSVERGHAIFMKICSVCHQLQSEGHAVGPDLAGVGDKSPEGLLIDILDPNRAVEPQYVNYVAETSDGQTISGILRRESGDSVTLAMPNGIEQSVLRSNLKSLRSTGLSLMPEGLESGLSAQDLADVIAFVAGSGAPPQRKNIESNHPELVLPTSSGILQLLPVNCEIFGPNLTLEKQYGNLGYWTSDADHATWSLQPARAGMYSVRLHYACDDTSAGNTLVLQSGTQRVAFRVESTGNWDTYRRSQVGQITLGAGRQRLTVRSEGKVHGALIDLRAIELVPEG